MINERIRGLSDLRSPLADVLYLISIHNYTLCAAIINYEL